jgi:hypothetical protein
MYLTVDFVIPDLSTDAHRGSYMWGIDLPNNLDIGIWLYIGFWGWKPLVDANLIRQMFQVLLYSTRCPGGWLTATRTAQQKHVVAQVAVYAVN